MGKLRNFRASKGERYMERVIAVDRVEDILSVFGSFDQNLRLIESELGVRVTDRDAEVHISGGEENAAMAEKAVEALLSLASRERTSTSSGCATSSAWWPRGARGRSARWTGTWCASPPRAAR